MSTSSRSKEKNGKSGGHSLHQRDEGSAARTRPISFEDIMLRRKKKGLVENIEKGTLEVEDMRKEGGGIDLSVSEGGYKHTKRSAPGVEKLASKVVRSSKREGEDTSIKDERQIRKSDRDNHESGMNAKVKDKGGKADQETRDSRKKYARSGDDIEKEHLRGLIGKDRHEGQSRGKYERDSKRKYRSGYYGDDKNISKSGKKHDLGNHVIEILGRQKKKESLISHFEESKLKRRRSRSRDQKDRSRSRDRKNRSSSRDRKNEAKSLDRKYRSRSRDHKDKSRRSDSISPQEHKQSSKKLGVQNELSSNVQEDRSDRRHSDVDKSRVSINGSSNQYRRHGGSSGLGGYSPRKRRTESAVKTPPPPNRSPDKKNATWDLPPSGKDNVSSGSIATFTLASNNLISSAAHDLSNATPVDSTTMRSLSMVASNPLLSKGNASIDSVQLTQATKHMRRLYVENVPSSTSEKAVIECLNDFMVSSGVNYIKGTKPCIGCILHKEKGQAVVEFLTPQDASAALSFDGSFFSGSTLKIRRPKDFFEMATGDVEKSVATDTISDIVEDSPFKLFIGGVAKAISAKMLMEIATAFGPLKAYHFEINKDLSQPCAFLEYVDSSVTLKACAGLNGMKVGGHVLTVVQAIPNASTLEHTAHPPGYGIPEHAKPLLELPTLVIKLKNVFDPALLSNLSELDVEEILDDIRLECARFGAVKSLNMVKLSQSHVTSTDAGETINQMESAGPSQDLGYAKKAGATSEEDLDQTRMMNLLQIVVDVEKLEEEERAEISDCIDEQDEDASPEQPTCPVDESECFDNKVAEIIETHVNRDKKLDAQDALVAEEADSEKHEDLAVDVDAIGKRKEPDNDLESVFERGSIFVEYGRTEASCMAAHCLHGRVFDGRIISVEYVALDIYRARFLK